MKDQMMRKIPLLIQVVLSTLLFTLLFYHQSLGVNLLLAEGVVVAWLLLSGQLAPVTARVGFFSAALLVSAGFTVVHHTAFGFTMHFIALMVFAGMLAYPQARSVLALIGSFFYSMFASQGRFMALLTGMRQSGFNPFRLLWKGRIFLIPVVVVFIFIGLYSGANPVFEGWISAIGTRVEAVLTRVFEHVDGVLIFVILFGLFISNFMLLPAISQAIAGRDQKSTDDLVRTRSTSLFGFKFAALNNELKAALFLFGVLNIVLLVVNAIDVYWVWFSFEWKGEYLKQFVHEGTYLLIVSILMSVVVVLYYFRQNLNFHRRNLWLKRLAVLWIVQNGVLVVSVAIRNLYYIQHFSLAYKRIGVIIFLILTLYGLFTVYTKVRQRRSAFYLFRTNSMAWFVVLLVSSLINWDMVIARYNFSHADRSFLHLDFMVNLSVTTLPLLDKPLAELQKTDSLQKKMFPFEDRFMTPHRYHQLIGLRKAAFQKEWESKTWLEWNLAEYRAYKKLNARGLPVGSSGAGEGRQSE